MRIALVLKQNEEKIGEHISQIVVFDVESDKVIGVENATVESDDVGILSKWALTEQVEEIYIPEVDDQVKPIFRMNGITMKAYDELGDNKLFQTFIV